MTLPDVWLRGPVEGVPALLQPSAHALLQALEDVERVVAELPSGALWARVGRAASPGFHLKHLIGATDRLLTYGRGEGLSEAQRTWLKAEAEPTAETAAELIGRFRAVVESGLEQLRRTPSDTLTAARAIGRARLPTTVFGCLAHAADHAARHAGQLITTVRAAPGG